MPAHELFHVAVLAEPLHSGHGYIVTTSLSRRVRKAAAGFPSRTRPHVSTRNAAFAFSIASFHSLREFPKLPPSTTAQRPGNDAHIRWVRMARPVNQARMQGTGGP